MQLAHNRWLVLGLVCVAQFMVILDATIVNVAMPTIERALHFSPTSLQWIVNAYTLVFGGLLLVGGRAAQGLGAALVSPAALAIVTRTFAEGAERTKALGVWSAIAAGGGAVGLVLGGLLTETLSWRGVFFIKLP